MDAIIAQWVLDAELIRTRVNRIDARIDSDESPQGGVLSAETEIRVSPSSDKTDEYLASISVKMIGYPKGTDTRCADTASSIFTIHVGVQGLYRTKKKFPAALLKDRNLTYMLGRPIYALAAAEVRALAVKMDFPGVKPAPDLPKPDHPGSVRPTPKEVAFLKGRPAVVATKATAKPHSDKKTSRLPAVKKTRS